MKTHAVGQIIWSIKREDLIDPVISGNKWRKLKYNLIEAKRRNCSTVLTYGGAYSNHILATASAAQQEGLNSIGVIRGEELGLDLQSTLSTNPTLAAAHAYGMQLMFVTREEYRNLTRARNSSQLFMGNEDNYEFVSNVYEIPEGGSNALAIKGCAEIIDESCKEYDLIAVSVGTGGTLAGIVEGSYPHQEVLGFSSLKGYNHKLEIERWTSKNNWRIHDQYHFGGYGKTTQELIQFINQFKKDHGILLDPIYTGKMMYGLFDLIRKGAFSPNTRILAIHTGGLQGIAGMNQKLAQRGALQIEVN
ncbi:1-aminocyclopropane-1-carboxylate deaminase/D-cysteine desulfhydrase [Croceiramulus getboli]|nr:pyridoxal-phosphate dependent enzyme [Flavobacteriaceae bacterium YJPT1-3]